jgi:hypothetical protein
MTERKAALCMRYRREQGISTSSVFSERGKREIAIFIGCVRANTASERTFHALRRYFCGIKAGKPDGIEICSRKPTQHFTVDINAITPFDQVESDTSPPS